MNLGYPRRWVHLDVIMKRKPSLENRVELIPALSPLSFILVYLAFVRSSSRLDRYLDADIHPLRSLS